MRSWAWLSLLAVAFAGCSDAPAQTGEDPFEAPDLETGPDVGAISGVVVSQTIVPIANASVSIVGGPATSTNDGGLFSFVDLEPGVYFIDVRAAGFAPVQSSAQVEAGQVSKPRIQMAADTSPQPFHETQQFAWFDSVGVTLVDFIIDLTDDTFLGDSLPDACDTCRFFFETSGPVETFVVEAVWTDSISKPTGPTSYFWTIADGEAWTNGYEDGYFTSPGLAHVGDNLWGNTTYMQVQMSADETWVTLDQSAEMFVTMFYVAAAPEGWSFVAGG